MSNNAVILYIDDNKENLDLVRRGLERRGFTCLIESNPFDGLILARDEQPDLVLLDIQMTRMSGFEVLEALRSSFLDRKIPIIALTANTVNVTKKICIDAGFDDYLSKPVLRKELIMKIEQHLGATTDS